MGHGIVVPSRYHTPSSTAGFEVCMLSCYHTRTSDSLPRTDLKNSWAIVSAQGSLQFESGLYAQIKISNESSRPQRNSGITPATVTPSHPQKWAPQNCPPLPWPVPERWCRMSDVYYDRERCTILSLSFLALGAQELFPKMI